MNRQLRRRTVAAACVFTITLLLNPSFVLAQEEEAELEEWEQNELRPLLERLNAAVAGDLPSEKPFEIAVDFLKGAEGSIYVPFTMTLDRSKLTQPGFAMYMFVTPHVEPPAADADAPASAEASAEETPGPTTYEDLFFVDVSESGTADGPLEVHRAFQAPGGTYDVYIVVRDSVGADGDTDALDDSMVMLLKEEVEVPDFWGEGLQTSSIIMAQSLDIIDAALGPEAQRINPYTIGTTQIVPKRDDVYGKSDNLALLFYVYNPKLTSEMNPDVTVEFDFHRVGPAGESFFNRTAPQEFNAQTWQAGVPVTGGLPSGQSVPLGSFPAGDFRLEIKITDKAAGQMLTRDVRFNVSE